MKLTVENLGPIKEGTISFDKPLTVMVGPNGTGKSYVSYLVYGMWTHRVDWSALVETKEVKNTIRSMRNKGGASVEISQESVKQVYTNNIEKIFPSIFASNFVKPKIGLSEDFVQSLERKLVDVLRELVRMKYRYKENIIIRFEQEINYGMYRRGKKSKTWFLPAERTALSMMSHDAVENKSKQWDRLKTMALSETTTEQDLKALLSEDVSKYPKAINDYIYFINDLIDLRRNTGPYVDLANEIEGLLLQGKVAVSTYGAILFTPDGADQALEVSISSSAVKSLAGLVLYLRHKARKGDTLIIDEPELNLHPNNQRVAARVLAKLVRAGFKVIVSTHSDYIIRELNNLTMIGTAFQDESTKAELLDAFKERHYHYDESTYLDKEEIGVYLFQDQTITALPVEEDGFEVPSINQEIEQMEEESHFLFGKIEAQVK